MLDCSVIFFIIIVAIFVHLAFNIKGWAYIFVGPRGQVNAYHYAVYMGFVVQCNYRQFAVVYTEGLTSLTRQAKAYKKA